MKKFLSVIFLGAMFATCLIGCKGTEEHPAGEHAHKAEHPTSEHPK